MDNLVKLSAEEYKVLAGHGGREQSVGEKLIDKALGI